MVILSGVLVAMAGAALGLRHLIVAGFRNGDLPGDATVEVALDWIGQGDEWVMEATIAVHNPGRVAVIVSAYVTRAGRLAARLGASHGSRTPRGERLILRDDAVILGIVERSSSRRWTMPALVAVEALSAQVVVRVDQNLGRTRFLSRRIAIPPPPSPTMPVAIDALRESC
jgi:hypothetical protein